MLYVKLITSLVILNIFLFSSIGLSASPAIMEKIYELQSIYQQGELKKAESLALEVLHDLNKEKDKDYLQITAMKNKLNGIYKKTEQYDKALKYIKDAYNISKREQNISSSDADKLSSWKFGFALYTWNLATTYKIMGQINNAMKYYEESIDNLIKLIGSNNEQHRSFAQFALPKSIDDLLIIYHELGMHNKADGLQRKIDNAHLTSPL